MSEEGAFSFDGRSVPFVVGDDVLTALVRAGVHPTGGGTLCGAGTCPNCAADIAWVEDIPCEPGQEESLRLALAEAALGEHEAALRHANHALEWFKRLGMRPDYVEAKRLVEELTSHWTGGMG